MRWPMEAARLPTHRRRASRAAAVRQSIATTFVMHAMFRRRPRQPKMLHPETYRKIAQALDKQGVASARGDIEVHTALHPATKRVGLLDNPMYAGRPVWNRTKWMHHLPLGDLSEPWVLNPNGRSPRTRHCKSSKKGVGRQLVHLLLSNGARPRTGN